MTWWNPLSWGRDGPKAEGGVPAPALTRDSLAWAEMFGAPGALPFPSETTALQISAVYGCVALISGAIAAMPMRVYRRERNGERDELPSDGLWWVLNEEFCPRWMAHSGWEFLVASRLLRGDAFAKIMRSPTGAVVGLVPIHPNRVVVGAYPDGSRLVYAVSPDPTVPYVAGQPIEVIDQDDMLHVPGFGFDGVRGLSPLRYHLAVTGASAIAKQDYAARFFANSARPDYALVAPASAQTLSLEKVESLRAQIDERHAGVAKSHRPMILQGGLDVKFLTMPLEEMQLLDSQRFSVEEIARIFGVPAFMIGHTEKTTSWGTGVEAMGTGFVRYTLGRHLSAFQNEINRKFFRMAGRVAEFDTFELERADMKSLFESFRIALGRAGEPGFMTAEEVRQKLNLKRRPDDPLNTGGAPDAQPPA